MACMLSRSLELRLLHQEGDPVSPTHTLLALFDSECTLQCKSFLTTMIVASLKFLLQRKSEDLAV